MFEDYTYEKLLEDILKNAPEGIDTRKGSIFFDSISAVTLKIAKYYTDLDLIVTMTTIMDAQGDALDAKAAEFGVYRRAATSAKYRAEFTGTTPQEGERFYYDGLYFVLRHSTENSLYYFEAEVPGEGGNSIYAGTPAVPVNNIPGLVSATFGAIYENGADQENDESLRNRALEKVAGPAENGNRQHYKTWCESVEGVGKARIFPLWHGENTVKAVLIDTTGQPCGEPKVIEVQNYIDPADKGMTVEHEGKTYTFGDGLGNGVANIGAHFTAVAANPVSITVSFDAELSGGAVKDTVKSKAEDAIKEYFRSLVMATGDEDELVVRVSAIGAILSSIPGLLDYKNLKLNGEELNITPGSDDVPVLSTVEIEVMEE